MLTFTIKHAQCWFSIWLVNHSVSECVWHMFGWHTAKQQDQPPSHTHALCPPVLNNGPAKALNICVLTPFKLLQSSADLACKSMCTLTLIKDYGHPLVTLMCYLCPMLHSPWETGLPFLLKWSWRSAGESVMQSERDAAFCLNSGLWSASLAFCSSWGCLNTSDITVDRRGLTAHSEGF